MKRRTLYCVAVLGYLYAIAFGALAAHAPDIIRANEWTCYAFILMSALAIGAVMWLAVIQLRIDARRPL